MPAGLLSGHVTDFCICMSWATEALCCRAREIATGRILALKKIKMEREKEGFPLTSIREINILLALHHRNIVNVTEVRETRKQVLEA